MYYAFISNADTLDTLDATGIKPALSNACDINKIESVTVINYTSPKVIILHTDSELTGDERQIIKETISSL